MIHKLLTLIILFSPLSYAENINISIPSTSIPQGISLERYNQLHLAYQRKVMAEKVGSDAKKANAKADAAAQARAERDAHQAKVLAERKVSEDATNKKTEFERIEASAKRDFETQVKNAWRVPIASSGQRANARVYLTDNGSVRAIIVQASDPDLKASVEKAIRDAAPYTMPLDPEARRQARIFNTTFIVK